MIRIAAITGGHSLPSARLRIRQHIPALSKQGFHVQEFASSIGLFTPVPGFSTKSQFYSGPLFLAWSACKLLERLPAVVRTQSFDITWLNKQVFPRMPTLEGFLKKPMVYDVDDAVWLGKPFGKHLAIHAAKHAAVVIAGNAFLADWFSQYCKNVQVIPTAVDTEKFCPGPPKEDKKTFCVGWIGTPANFKYLEDIEGALAAFLQQTNSELLIVSSCPPYLPNIPNGKLRFVQWAEETEVSLIQQMDVGIMPLRDDDWCRGKCSMKMLQYMACGIPVIVSPVGMNSSILRYEKVGIGASNIATWLSALHTYYAEENLLKLHGNEARKIVVRFYSKNEISQRISMIFSNLA